MMDLSCDMCMDLLPLVQDGIASEDSCQAVQQHLAHCPQCRAAFTGTLPPPEKGSALLTRMRRSVRLLEGAVLLFGLILGVSLTGSGALFYNVLLMPVAGALGYLIFRWKAAGLVPGLLFVIHLLPAFLHLPLGQEVIDPWVACIAAFYYSLFALTGVVIAGLFHFAFRKEHD